MATETEVPTDNEASARRAASLSGAGIYKVFGPKPEQALAMAADGASRNDILLATASNAIVVGFNTAITETARRAAEEAGKGDAGSLCGDEDTACEIPLPPTKAAQQPEGAAARRG